MKKSLWIIVVLLLSIPIYAQKVGIAPAHSNYFYRGVDTPVKIVVANYHCDSISVSSNMQIRKSRDCEYIVIPRDLKTSTISVSGIKNGEKRLLGNYQFRVWSVPNPKAIVGERPGELITLNQLMRTTRIKAKLDDFVYGVDFKVNSYTAVVEKNKEIIFNQDFTGDRFTTELRSKFHDLGTTDIIR